MARVKRIKRLEVQRLEERAVPAVTAAVFGSTLDVFGDAGRDRIVISQNDATNQLVVADHGREVRRFNSAAISAITVDGGGGQNISVRVLPNVLQPTTLVGTSGKDLLQAGGGPSTQLGTGGNDKLIGGPSQDALFGGAGRDLLRGGRGLADTLVGGPGADKLVGVKAVDVDQLVGSGTADEGI